MPVFGVIGVNPEDETMQRTTVTIVTTSGNKTLKRIHNNPKMLARKHSANGRIPVIIPKDLESRWLEERDYNDPLEQQALVEEVCQPYPDEEIEAYPVPKLNEGRESLNEEGLLESHSYPELQRGDLF